MQLPPEQIRFHAPLKGARAVFGRRASLTQEELQERLTKRFEEGYQQGQRALGQQLVQQRAELSQLHSGALKRLQDAVQDVARETEQTLAELVLAYVQKIVAHTPITAQMLGSLVAESVEGLARDAIFEIRLHPEDAALLQTLRDENGALDMEKGLLVPDPDLQRGDCLVKTRFGTIDATREAKLANIARELAC